ncbi:MAG: indolepyruvate oxidoreductase subunit beta [Clostridia bacterium]|nr:indolepyruvate oxidoreductase subunit beta [Clostridia bacterium]
MEPINIMIVGVGGQGTLLASRVIGAAAVSSKLDCKVSEVHGMSQRGGSVVTYCRVGGRIFSPLVEKGHADVLLCFERLEALRWSGFLRRGGLLILNDERIDPMPVIAGAQSYPGGIIEALQAGGAQVTAIDAAAIADECGDRRAANTVLLGVLASKGIAGIARETWEEAVCGIVPAKALEINRKAFQKGYERGSGQ